jgi:hypothetical protein
MKKGHLLLILGISLVLSIPVWAATVTDNFNRADAGTLGANYTVFTAFTQMSVLTNQAATTTTNANNGGYWSANTFGNDQFIQLTFVGSTTNVNNGRMYLRTDVGRANNYSCGLIAAVDATNYSCITTVANSVTHTYTTTTAFATNDVWRMQIIGSSFKFMINGATVVNVTDTDVASGFIGFTCRDTTTAPKKCFDDFSAGDIAHTQVGAFVVGP